jgi:hypothetical protein
VRLPLKQRCAPCGVVHLGQQGLRLALQLADGPYLAAFVLTLSLRPSADQTISVGVARYYCDIVLGEKERTAMLRSAAEQAGKRARASEQGRRQLKLATDVRRNPAWSWLVTAFGQPFGGWNDGQDVYLYRLFEFWTRGELAVGQISVGTTPGPDADRAGNQAALDVLPRTGADDPEGSPGFSAFVDPDQRLDPSGDGSFRWSGEVHLGICVPGQPQAAAWAHIDPMEEGVTVPLEIGYTDTQTTYMHLVYGNGLARWAYGSKNVVLLVPSTFVREASLADDPTVRWKPKRMWHPSDEIAHLVKKHGSVIPTNQETAEL